MADSMTTASAPKLYRYRARRGDGSPVEGELFARDERDLDRRLSAEDLLLVEAKSIRASRGSGSLALTRDELCELSQALATMLDAGVPILRAFELTVERTDSKRVRSVVGDLIELLRQGASLSEAMERHPRSFPEVFRACVRAGELSSGMPRILRRQAGYLRWVREIRATLSQALVYPTILSLAIGVLVVVLVTFLVPRFVSMVPAGMGEMPLPTRIVMGASNFMRESWMPLLAGVALAAAAAWFVLRQPRLRLAAARAVFRLPRLGRVVQMIATARLANASSTLHGAGCEMISTLELSARSCGNVAVRKAIDNGVARIRSGHSLTEAFESEPDLDPLFVQMTAVGETSGRLSECWGQVSEGYDAEVPRRVKWALSLIEPLIIVVGGSVVALVMLSAILPILDLYENL
jgi:general secretion pathway protein F